MSAAPNGLAGLRVAVVICAYTDDRFADLCRAVTSVKQQSAQAAEVTVVIDHNEALLHRALRQFPNCEVVANRYDRGLSGARNTGIDATTAEIVAFVDDDACADVDWLARLQEPFLDDGVLAVGGTVVADWEVGRPRWFPSEFDWVVGCSYVGLPDRRAPIRNVIGCNMSVRRTVFDAVGGFRSDLGRIAQRPLGCEETELCIRARHAFPAGEVVYEPSAVVHHRVPQSRGTFRYFRSRCRAEGYSKAHVATLVGAESALSSERAYVRRVLPRGVVRALGGAARLDGSGVARAATIVTGLATVSIGYLEGRRARRTTRDPRLAVTTT